MAGSLLKRQHFTISHAVTSLSLADSKLDASHRERAAVNSQVDLNLCKTALPHLGDRRHLQYRVCAVIHFKGDHAFLKRRQRVGLLGDAETD